MRHYTLNYMHHVALRYLHTVLKLRPSSYPYISGDSIRTIAQHRFEQSKSFNTDNIKNSDIIFVESQDIKKFFTEIAPDIHVSFILVSHNGDTNITEEYRPFLASKYLIHWFAQNCLITDPKISPLPIGLENKWFHLHGLPKYFDKLKKENFTKKTEMLYKFSVVTNPNERGTALDILKRHPLAKTYTDWREPLPYLKTLKQYKFVVSPPGNGVDCIRTWEAMYLETVPIVKRSVMTEYFYDCGLPLILIDDWENLFSFTEEKLNEMYDTIQPRFNSEALGAQYWFNKILSKVQ